MTQSNPKPVEGARISLESATTIGEQIIAEYQRLERGGYTHWHKSSIGLMVQAGVEAALSAAAPRCNRCAADLCEHDNCTDWTCARACGKCAPGPAPARDGVDE